MTDLITNREMLSYIDEMCRLAMVDDNDISANPEYIDIETANPAINRITDLGSRGEAMCFAIKREHLQDCGDEHYEILTVDLNQNLDTITMQFGVAEISTMNVFIKLFCAEHNVQYSDINDPEIISEIALCYPNLWNWHRRIGLRSRAKGE